MKNLIALLLFLLASNSVTGKIKEGDIPPSYLGENRSGQEVSLDEMKGKVVIATFWASWCAPCIAEMTVLEKIQRKVGKDKLEVVAVNFKESKKVYSKIKDRLKDMQITMTHDSNGKISRAYGVRSIPHMFIINRIGLVEKIHHGYGEAVLPELVSEINALLNDKTEDSP